MHHVTPSPHTVFGQKGSGESGYLGAPAAISSAINDAVRIARHSLRAAPHPHLGHRRRDCQGQGTAMKLDIGGEELIEAPIERLWASLNDPAFLTRCIPGCRSMQEIAPDSYAVRLDLKVASVGGSFEGKIALSDKVAPERCCIAVSGSGTLGHGSGEARFKLAPAEGGTLLDLRGQRRDRRPRRRRRASASCAASPSTWWPSSSRPCAASWRGAGPATRQDDDGGERHHSRRRQRRGRACRGAGGCRGGARGARSPAGSS